MTAIAVTAPRTAVTTQTIARPAKETVRLGVTLTLMALFLVVAFVGAVADVAGVVIGAGLMTAIVSLALVIGTFKDAIESPEA